ncbi:Quinoprotein ethanol dehydrogenase [Trichinella pseudospiralis]
MHTPVPAVGWFHFVQRQRAALLNRLVFVENVIQRPNGQLHRGEQQSGRQNVHDQQRPREVEEHGQEQGRGEQE